jgi:hypothetical protein
MRRSPLAGLVFGLLLSTGAAAANEADDARGRPKPPLVSASVGFAHAFQPRSISNDAARASFELRPVRPVSIGLEGTLYSPFDGGYSTSPDAPRRTQAAGAVLLGMKVFVAETRARTAELYLLGGIGGIWTRPLAVRDPLRRFEFDQRFAFTSGVGGRLRVVPHVALFAEGRATAYTERLEAQEVASGQLRANRMTWFDERGTFAVVLDAQLGVLVHL